MSTIGVIDIATSVIRACNKALQTMFQITLTDIPEITKRSVQDPKIQAPFGTITAFIRIKENGGSSYLQVKIEKDTGKKLLEKAGMTGCSDQEVIDSCGELCNLIAGFFKTELVHATGLHNIEITVPKLYTDSVDENIDGVDVNARYLITVFYKGIGLVLNAEIAFKDKQD